MALAEMEPSLNEAVSPFSHQKYCVRWGEES